MKRRLAVGLSLVVGALVPGLGARASAQPGWAPAGRAAIHPGVQTFTQGAQCTSNFVFTDGTDVYLGQAAHCSSTGSATDTDGCTTPTLPLGTPVVILDAPHPGTLVYDSWLTMQAEHEKDAATCAANDLALIKVDRRDIGTVNPSIPFWGGPRRLATAEPQPGATVYSYGNSVLRLGITLLSPKRGTASGDADAGWAHVVTTVTPGISGDSGSAFLDANGDALAVLSDIAVGVPDGVENIVGDLGHELDYLHAHSRGTRLAKVKLVAGDLPFRSGQLPVDPSHPVGDPVGGLRQFFGV